MIEVLQSAIHIMHRSGPEVNKKSFSICSQPVHTVSTRGLRRQMHHSFLILAHYCVHSDIKPCIAVKNIPKKPAEKVDNGCVFRYTMHIV